MKSSIQSTQYLGQIVQVDIDRPLGSNHPKHGFEYKLNYGFVPDTVSGDDEELDVYVMGVGKPLKTFEGRCVAVIHRTNDDDDKLVVIPEGGSAPNEDEIRAATHFQEQFFTSEVIF